MTSKVTVLLGIIVVILVSSNYLFYNEIQSLKQVIQTHEKQNSMLQEKIDQLNTKSKSIETIPEETVKAPPSIQDNMSNSSKYISAVAVKPVFFRDGFFEEVRYEGTVMKITTDIRDGKGLVLVNTETPTGVDFQTSAKTAVKIAQENTGIGMSDKDIIFTISSESKELQAVDGPSAGAAMAILLVAEIEGKPIKEDVLITGTIEPSGDIGKIGGVTEKADAAGKYGAKILLVPSGQAITHVQTCKESKNGPFIYRSCTIEEKPLSPIMEERYGLQIIEVKNIVEALKYFI